MTSDFDLTADIYRISTFFHKHLSEWMREIGDHPHGFTFGKNIFERLCAEEVDRSMRRGASILTMIESFKIAGPNSYVTITKSGKDDK